MTRRFTTRYLKACEKTFSVIEVIHFFETVVRNAFRISEPIRPSSESHPFELRDVHPSLPFKVRQLFDDAHYSQATFEACKYLDATVKKHAGLDESGKVLMMKALSGVSPLIKLTFMNNTSERNEQEGYKFLFAGTMIAIRNPRGHEYSMDDDVGTCLDHLTLVSHLLRRLEQSGYR